LFYFTFSSTAVKSALGVGNPVCSCPAGLFDVLPAGCLDGLTAEDFRLLLNGVGDINVATLISYTSFNDESGEPGDR
jgi:E3 ubiquitin-protein ligase EDD1